VNTSSRGGSCWLAEWPGPNYRGGGDREAVLDHPEGPQEAAKLGITTAEAVDGRGGVMEAGEAVDGRGGVMEAGEGVVVTGTLYKKFGLNLCTWVDDAY